jgi:hypothetical protein
LNQYKRATIHCICYTRFHSLLFPFIENCKNSSQKRKSSSTADEPKAKKNKQIDHQPVNEVDSQGIFFNLKIYSFVI